MTRATDFDLVAIDGTSLPLARFARRPLVIVNTASRCGFTPQYAVLEELWREKRGEGLVVVGVPSNDFGGQEPGENDAIAAFCRATFGVDFPLARKVHVRGPDAHPLFRWLAAEGGYLARPRWNFYKYLIGRDGRLADWFASVTSPGAPRFRRALARILAP